MVLVYVMFIYVKHYPLYIPGGTSTFPYLGGTHGGTYQIPLTSVTSVPYPLYNVMGVGNWTQETWAYLPFCTYGAKSFTFSVFVEAQLIDL